MRDFYRRKYADPKEREIKNFKARERYHQRKAAGTLKKRKSPPRPRAKDYYEKRYGIPDEQAYALLADQGGKCAICRGEANHLDHDHTTGKIRAWLCGTCNTGLGMFHESQTKLRAAIEYLDAVTGG